MGHGFQPIPVLMAFLLFVMAGCSALPQSAKEKREAAYQAALQSYSEVLKPGMTRKEVQIYLQGKNVTFGQLCCIDEPSALPDLVKIGKEKHPWYCSAHVVYIAFQFSAVESHKPWQAYDSDTLKRITIFHQLEGCL